MVLPQRNENGLDPQLVELAEGGVAAATSWLGAGLGAELVGPVVFVASGATWPAALLWARLHESAGHPAWALTPYEFEHRAFGPDTQVVLISMSGNNIDMVRAARVVVERGLNGRALSAEQRSAMATELARAGRPVHLLPQPPDEELIASPFRIIGLTAAGARVYGGERNWPSMFEPRGPLIEIPNRPQRLFCLGAGLAGPAAWDFCEKSIESGYAMATCTDVRNFAHGSVMAIGDALADALIAVFATASEREYFEALLAELPAALPRILIADVGDGIDAAVRLIAAGVRLFDEAAHQAGLRPTHADVPPWGRRVFFLARK